MADIINLNRARKARAKVAATAKAVENRAKFGRTKAEKDAEKRARDRAERALNDSKLD